ncbi:hypothetical protein HNR46_001127 [Haloferula luteola]|uniref:Uncharacterized protein n=1 Tax=Haloferula luteola TaxID=595692 RepID=A0A840V0N9_9BACT|nr:hypothetical protein [Haloferula luteola]MBB5350893.1 hypothetical protein [Haloferula luteola]
MQTFPRLLATVFAGLLTAASAQDVTSRALTDAIYRGDGVINLLKDISGSALTSYFTQTGGLLLLGADVNESNSGNESRDSLGVAIKQVQLSITTTAGDFTFSDFFTNTTAQLRENGSSVSSDYYTLFGQAGSSNITGNANLGTFDDVMWLENVTFTGEILSANLQITLLDTPTKNATGNESFFDFSGGFEDFALLSAADAAQIDDANIGVSAAPSDINFATTRSVGEAIAAATAGTSPAPEAGAPAPITSPPAAPAPPWLFAAALGGLAFLKPRKSHA